MYVFIHNVQQQPGRTPCASPTPNMKTTYKSTKSSSGYSVIFTQARKSSDHVDRDHVDHVPSSSAELRPRRPRPRRPRPEQLRRAPTTSTTRPRRNDDRREERRYDNRDHSHDDRSKSSRTGQLHRQRHVKPSLEHRNTSTTPTGRQ